MLSIRMGMKMVVWKTWLHIIKPSLFNEQWLAVHLLTYLLTYLISYLLTYLLIFTTFVMTSISVDFPFFSNTKTTTTMKNCECEKLYLFWKLYVWFCFFKYNLNCVSKLSSKFSIICTNLPPLALDNQR